MADSREQEGSSWVGDVRQTYRDRDARLPYNEWRRNLYHPRHPLGRLFQSQNRDSLIDVLNDRDIDLAQVTVLDVGCGYGAWLRHFVELGARPSNLTGIDLSPERIEIARETNPAITWVQATGTDLPFSDESFDFVLQVLVFSSLPDEDVQRRLAAEIDRVTRPGANILWVDLKTTATESLRTFSRAEAQSFFPNATLTYARPVHPRYFRRHYGRSSWLATSVYRLTGIGCESWLLLFTKPEPRLPAEPSAALRI